MNVEKIDSNIIKKVIHDADMQHVRFIMSHQNTSDMHDQRANFDKFFYITKSVFKNRINSFDNIFAYRQRPKMSDYEINSQAVTSESLGIDSESYFWGKLTSDFHAGFPYLIDRSNYNRRLKRLYPLVEELNQHVSAEMNQDETVFLIDSIPVPVCQVVREKRSKICKENFETAPDKGFSAESKSYYYGYKLHLLTSIRGVFHSMDLSKASVHDIHYLSQVKNSGLNNCTLIADKGYLSTNQQLDLFTFCSIELQTSKRNNQKDYQQFVPIFKRTRKRIETLFSQLCDQFMLKRNYTRSLLGLSVSILTKITAATLLQFINLKNDKPLNHLKYALAN